MRNEKLREHWAHKHDEWAMNYERESLLIDARMRGINRYRIERLLARCTRCGGLITKSWDRMPYGDYTLCLDCHNDFRNLTKNRPPDDAPPEDEITWMALRDLEKAVTYDRYRYYWTNHKRRFTDNERKKTAVRLELTDYLRRLMDNACWDPDDPRSASRRQAYERALGREMSAFDLEAWRLRLWKRGLG